MKVCTTEKPANATYPDLLLPPPPPPPSPSSPSPPAPPLLFGELVYQHTIGNGGINPLDPVFRLAWAIYHMVLCAPFKRGHGEVLVLLLSVPNQILERSRYSPSLLWNYWGKVL